MPRAQRRRSPGAAEREGEDLVGLESNVAHERTAFGIGWDLACYGQPCEEADPNVQDGYAAGKAHFGAQTTSADRFTRKWLQLRRNAWRRRRVFSEDVTPEFLREIDVPRCPVLGIELTHGTQTDTDWSVDRLNNEGAYARGNLIVMSTRANAAKGALSFREVVERANASEPFRGLPPKGWLRLASLMAYASIGKTAGGTCFVLAHPWAPQVPLLFSQFLQSLFLQEQRGGPRQVMRQIRKRGMTRPAERDAFDRLVKHMRKRERRRPSSADFWAEPALYSTFERWYMELSRESLNRIAALVEARAPRSHMDVRFDDWSLETRGFYKPKLEAELEY